MLKYLSTKAEDDGIFNNIVANFVNSGNFSFKSSNLFISKLIDNNEGFWQTFKELVSNSVKEIGVDKLTEIFRKKLNY